MIDKKYEKYVFAILMGSIMSFIISFINLGFIDGFFIKWMEAFFKAAVCAIPIISIVAPRVKKIVGKIVKD